MLARVLTGAFLAIAVALSVPAFAGSQQVEPDSVAASAATVGSVIPALPAGRAAPSEPLVRVAQGKQNAWNVHAAVTPSGVFVATGGGNWLEAGQGGGRFNFREENRDEWSIYLLDASRNVRLQLDFHRMQIFYSDGNQQNAPLYQIVNYF